MIEYINFFTFQDGLWLFTVILDLFVTLLLYKLFGKKGLYAIIIFNIMLSNLQGPKLTVIFGMETSVGVILYSSIYFATDLLSEKYGRKEAQGAVLLGFIISIIMVLMIFISLLFLPSQTIYAQNVHDAMNVLFSFTPIFVFGSLFVYLITQSVDIWIFHAIKKKTNGRHLWLRNNVSTILSQALDTVLYALIVWAPIVGFWKALALAMSKYIIKILIALIDTVFLYWAIEWKTEPKSWRKILQLD
jgi:uncharacterized integral membrane protein (TIGR00697 family)